MNGEAEVVVNSSNSDDTFCKQQVIVFHFPALDAFVSLLHLQELIFLQGLAQYFTIALCTKQRLAKQLWPNVSWKFSGKNTMPVDSFPPRPLICE